jgi:hypothetical protein
MIDWDRIPWPLWAFALLLAAGMIQVEVLAHDSFLVKVLFALLMLAWAFFLLKGERWLWILTVAISILGFIPVLISGSFISLGTAITLIGLVLLLLPATRRYFARETVAH